ncbi:hypothetical protein HDU91_001307 [Kappamyces sp. JEL0680]|nr:hypothetical protein HDU91_001307 [Kappamyces sp. JEL0680]
MKFTLFVAIASLVAAGVEPGFGGVGAGSDAITQSTEQSKKGPPYTQQDYIDSCRKTIYQQCCNRLGYKQYGTCLGVAAVGECFQKAITACAV